MPLTYDDIPGSWGTYSEDWPFTVDHPLGKYVFANKTGIIPYGTYVFMSDTHPACLRVENAELLEKLDENFDIVYRAIKEEELT